MSDETRDPEAVLAEAIIGASRAVRDGHPQTALDVIDAVLMTLPETGAEAIELAALPTKIMALAHLGRRAEAEAQLVTLEALAAKFGGEDDHRACQLLRERLREGVDVQTRMQIAMAAIQGGKAEALVDLERLVEEAAAGEQHVLVVGALMFLGKVYAGAERADLAQARLVRARDVLEKHAPLEGERLAIAIAEIDKLLAAISN